MASIGWIKLHRKIQECDLWDSSEEPFDRRSAWIDLLLLANHEDKKIIFNGKHIVVKAGQRITSLRILALRWNWSVERVRRFLNLLEEGEMIVRESDSRKTLLTIVNYGIYQGQRDTNEYTDETPTSTPTRHERDTDETPTRHQRDTNKNDKNEENEKNEKNEKEVKKIYGEYRHVRLTDSERERLDIDFGVEKALDMIKILDEYIETSGRKYKNHNLVLRGWVLERVNQRRPASKEQSKMDSFKEALAQFVNASEEGT